MTYRKHFTTVALTWACCFIVFFFAYLLVLAPQNKSKKMAENGLAKTSQEYQSALKATQDETKIQLKKEIEQLQNKLKDFIIDFEDSANLTFDISRIASEKRIASFSIKSKRSGAVAIPNCKYIGENQIDISFTASFDQFTAFLSALERHRPVVFVDEFRMRRSLQDRNRTGHRVNMSVVVFVRKQQGS